MTKVSCRLVAVIPELATGDWNVVLTQISVTQNRKRGSGSWMPKNRNSRNTVAASARS